MSSLENVKVGDTILMRMPFGKWSKRTVVRETKVYLVTEFHGTEMHWRKDTGQIRGHANYFFSAPRAKPMETSNDQ